MQTLLLYLIRCYQILISPVLGPHCRFHPSCSSYALTAIERFGIWRGLLLTSRRLIHCHPLHPGGVDPVPSEWPGFLFKKTSHG